MKAETSKKVDNILNALSDKKEIVTPPSVVDPNVGLRDSIVSFFTSRIKSVEHQEKLKTLVQTKLEKKIEEEDLTFAQLKDLFVVLSRETVNASQDILKVAHPKPGQSALHQDFTNTTPVGSGAASGELSGDMQRKIDALYRFLKKSKLETPET